MAVKLHIVADSYEGARVEPFEVQDGHIITVRRHSQGADVFVVPEKGGAEARTQAAPPSRSGLIVPGHCDHCGAWIGFGIDHTCGCRKPAEGVARDTGRSDLRDMGATLVDKARARLIDAQAAKLEAETRDRHRPPQDDGSSPVQVEGWKASGRSDFGTVHATLSDREGREYQLTLLPASARELAEALLSGARFAETGREL